VDNLIESILSGDLSTANKLFAVRLSRILAEKINDRKVDVTDSIISEKIQNVRRIGRVKLVRMRIRRGKLQRRRKVAAVKGFTIRKNKVIRMKPKERLHRRMAARRAKIKRKAKKATILRKRKMAFRKRAALGISPRMKWKR
jgi:hypothetical protein